MKILVAADGSPFTKRMLAYLAAHDEWLGSHHAYTVLNVTPRLPSRAAAALSNETLAEYYAREAETVFKPIRPFFVKQGLAATYLAVEAEGALRDDFRRRAAGAGLAVFGCALLAGALSWREAPAVFAGLTARGWSLPLHLGTGAAAVTAFAALFRGRVRAARAAAAIQVALAYTDAQEEYRARDWDGDGVKEYARRGLSSPGKHDGLYWASLPGEPESPLGVEFADAKPGQPYHGYLFKILTAQGKDAPGGARSYLKSGHMTEGYALVAWPAKYNDTGVMTFIVNQDGVVYQKNLGANTDAAARAIGAYNPDASWTKVAPGK